MKILRWLLWPFSLPYGIVVRARALCYSRGIIQPKRLDGVVVSVGNLTTGGTGKTPMVLWLCQKLLAEGKKPGVLTRGYKGRDARQGTQAGSGGIAQKTSDEAAIFARRLGGRVPVGIGASRYARGRELEGRGVNWLVLDDGFQHLQLARDVNLLLVDAENPFGGGLLLPAGRLREPLSAMKRAGVIVITRSASDPALEARLRRFTRAPVFYAETAMEKIFPLGRGGEAAGVSAQETRRFFAFCAIGNPEAFGKDLQRWGVNVAGQAAFRDHHRFTERDADELQRRARAANADALLCTEKDIFNIEGCVFNELPVFVCSIRLVPAKPDELWKAILAAVERARPERG